MATQLQIRRGTAAQVAAFTGAEGEIVYNSTKDSLHTNDGSTAGGFELARADGSNFSSSISFTTLSAGTLNVSGAATFSGAVTANAGVKVDNFTLDGTTLALSSGDFTLDVAGDINFDAGGADINLRDGGTAMGRLGLENGDLNIASSQQDYDIKFKGNDGGSVITALTLDMSAAGAASFNAGANFNGTVNMASTLAVVGAVNMASTLAVAGEITANGGIALGDGDRAKFGTSDDLVVYHDGNNSYITDVGTGNLKIGGANVEITTAGGTLYFQGAANVAKLYHTGNQKLATTASGIDVLGVVTADGLTVDGGSSSPNHLLTGARAGTLVSIDNESTSTSYGLLTNTASVSANSYPLWVTSNDVNRLTVGGNGDISFYNTAGDSQSLFWDASAKSLGIGTSSPSGKLTISSDAGVANQYLNFVSTQSGSARSYSFGINSGAFRLFDLTANVERLSISAAGTTTITGSLLSSASGAGANAFSAGLNAGASSQGASALAIGHAAGQTNQGASSVAVGVNAGTTSQGGSATAVGNSAGNSLQGLYATAIGVSAGNSSQGSSAVAVGLNAGQTNQGANGILINSSGATLNDTSTGHIRLKSTTGELAFTTAAGWSVSDDLAVTGAVAINANIQNPLTINSSLNNIVYNEVFNTSTGASAAVFQGIVTQNLANSGTIRSGLFYDSSNHLSLINGEAGFAGGIVLHDNNAVTIPGSLAVTGALSGGGMKAFKIDHPLKPDTHDLVHSVIEAPQADLLYSGVSDLVNGSAEVNIDEYHGMTEGTFVALNRNIRVLTTNESDWEPIKGSVAGNILSISCQDASCSDKVSWLVIGERQDDGIKSSGLTDEQGRVIVEPLKPEVPEEPAPVQRTVSVPVMLDGKQVEALETSFVPESIEVIDGVAVLTPATTQEVLKPQFEEIGVVDLDGNPVYS